MSMMMPATATGTCQGMKKGGVSSLRTLSPKRVVNPTPIPKPTIPTENDCRKTMAVKIGMRAPIALSAAR